MWKYFLAIKSQESGNIADFGNYSRAVLCATRIGFKSGE